MTKIQKTLLIVHICLTIPFVLVCGILVYLDIVANEDKKRGTAFYEFCEDEYMGAPYYVAEEFNQLLGKRKNVPAGRISYVRQLEGIHVEECLGYVDVSLFPDSYVVIREGAEDPILRYGLKRMMSEEFVSINLEDIDLTAAFRDGTVYDRSDKTFGTFSHREEMFLYFGIPCGLRYQCVLAQEAETGSLYFIYELIDWEAEAPELTPGEMMYWPTQTYICEVTDLLADRLPEDFWE